MTVLEELASACPANGARPAGPADDVDGVAPAAVARPASTSEVAATMVVTARHGLRVVTRGAGTKLDWGLPPLAAEVVLNLSAMDRILEHSSGDLVVRVEAGARLAQVQAALARHGQWLPIDEVVPGSTLGGIVATGLSGPSRHRHGAVRDLLIGATVVRADGAVAKAGGKVVKNVAGYDLCKLFTGSYGTLVVLTELVLRLRPLPHARRFLGVRVPEARLEATLAAVRRSQVEPTALELVRDDPDGPVGLTVLLEGRPGPLRQRVEALAALLGAPEERDGPPPGWGTLPGEVTVKVTSPPAAVPGVVRLVREAADTTGLAPLVRSSAGVGVTYVGLGPDAPVEALATLLGTLRRRGPETGATTVLRAPRAVRQTLDVWGEVPGLDLMRKVKSQFDPEGRLAPGRFVGGI